MSRVGSSIDAGLNSGNKMPQDLGLSNTTGDSTDNILTGSWEKGRKPVSNVSKRDEKTWSQTLCMQCQGSVEPLICIEYKRALKT